MIDLYDENRFFIEQFYIQEEINNRTIIGNCCYCILDMRFLYPKAVSKEILLYKKIFFCQFEAVTKQYLKSTKRPLTYDEYIVKINEIQRQRRDPIINSWQKSSPEKTREEIIIEYNKIQTEIDSKKDYWCPEYSFDNSRIPLDYYSKLHNHKIDRIPLYIDFITINDLKQVSDEDNTSATQRNKIENIIGAYKYGTFDLAAAYRYENRDDDIFDLIEEWPNAMQCLTDLKRFIENDIDQILIKQKDYHVFLNTLGELVEQHATKTTNIDVERLNLLKYFLDKLEINPLSQMLNDIFFSFIEQLSENHVIGQCEHCSQFFIFQNSKKYCSQLKENRDCGKSARYKRYYNKSKNK